MRHTSSTFTLNGRKFLFKILTTIISINLITNSTNSAVLAQSDELLELDDYEFWAEQCQELARSRQYQEALTACDESIKFNDDVDETIDVWLIRGEVLVYLGEHENALSSLNRVLQEEPSLSLAMTYQCMAQYQLSRYEDAVDSCESALITDGYWGRQSPTLAWYYRGLSLQQLGFLETAVASFERALQINANSLTETSNDAYSNGSLSAQLMQDHLGGEQPLVYAEWCNTLHLLGEGRNNWISDRSEIEPCGLENAISSYERAIALNPQDAVLLQQQAFALEQQGQYERALLGYEQALQLNPEHPRVLTRHCGVLNQLDRYEEALSSCEAALQNVQPQNEYEMAYRLNQHSIALLGLERYDEALISSERAIDVLPTYAPAYNSKAVALWRNGQTGAAISFIERATALYREQSDHFEDTFYRPNTDPWPIFYRDYGLALFNQGGILAHNFSNAGVDSILDNYRQSIALPLEKLAQHSSDSNDGLPQTWEQLSGLSDADLSSELLTTVVYHVQNRNTLSVLSLQRFENTLINLAATHLSLNPSSNPSRARDYSSVSVELNPESVEAWYNLGLAMYRLNYDLTEVYDAYYIAHYLQPDNIQVLMAVGGLLEIEGKLAEAIAVYEQILVIDSENLPAQIRLDRLLNEI
jgi:tetratricopeptide (TPR) repeat protein